jgi:hypothetical protein
LFGFETNVSVGQFNQSSIEILFTICYGPGQRSGEPSKVLGGLFCDQLSTKEPRKAPRQSQRFQ